MKKILLIFIMLIVLIITGCSIDKVQTLTNKKNEYILMVKNGYPEKYPDSTYGNSFDNFFSSKAWKYFKSDDEKDIVEFTGNCIYEKVEVEVKIQFVLDISAGEFEPGDLSFNEVPQNELMTAVLFSKIFGDEEEKITISVEIENTYIDSNDSTEEDFYGDWVISKLAKNGTVGTYSNDDINKKIIGRKLNFSKEKSSSFGDDISYMYKIVNNPTYEKSVISKKDFNSYYPITLNSLGINDDPVTIIDVIDARNNIECSFIIKDKNTLILYGGGSFFELNRI